MANLNADQVAQYAVQAGFTGQALVTAIAVSLAEDPSGSTTANNTSGEDSRGLWQINVAPGAHPQLASLNLFDPLINAQQAFAISSQGTNWGAWTTYTGGKYRQYLQQATLAAENATNAAIAQGIPMPSITGLSAITQASLGQPQTGVIPPLSLPSNITVPSIPGADAITQAVTNLSNLLGQIPGAINAPFANAFNNLQAVGAFLSQPHLVERVLLLLGGAALLLVGLILFALSFVHTSAVKVG